MRPLEIERALEEWKLIEPPEVLVAVIDGVLLFSFFFLTILLFLLGKVGNNLLSSSGR